VAQLIAPASRVHASFLAAMAEFRAEGRGRPGDPTLIGREMRRFGDQWADPAGFAAYITWLRANAGEQSPRAGGLVPATTSLWWAEEDEYLGRVAIRHRLTPRLLSFGGNIGYDVRPSARRHGHATAMLAAALPVARELGITSALIMCDVANVGSRKVIEANGGVLEGERDGRLCFWAPTARPRHAR
jgi:predicted acetyltransferase